MKKTKPINVTPQDRLAYGIKASYFKNAAISTLTGGGRTLSLHGSSGVVLLGRYSPNSQLGGRVFGIGGLAPTITAGTHGYGMGCILVEDKHS